jgi:hypothetical protein
MFYFCFFESSINELKQRIKARDEFLKANKERNRQIAAALSIDNPVISSIPEVVYPESIVRFASERPKLAITVETNLRRLAKQCEEAPGKGTFEYNLPPMNKKERMFVHELSDFYNIESKGKIAFNRNIYRIFLQVEEWSQNATCCSLPSKG